MRNSALSAQPLFKHEHGCRIAPGPTKQTNTSVARSGKNTSTRFETSGNPGGSHFYARRVPHSDAHSRCLAAAIHRRHGGVQVVGVREEPRSVDGEPKVLMLGPLLDNHWVVQEAAVISHCPSFKENQKPIHPRHSDKACGRKRSPSTCLSKQVWRCW